MPINRDIGNISVNNFPANQNVTPSETSAEQSALSLTRELLLQQKLTNLYLSEILGDTFTEDDIR